MRRRPYSLRSPREAVLLAAILALDLAGGGAPARALTADEIERTSALATGGLMSITERLAAEDFAGRDNDSPSSPRVERYLLSWLRLIGEGLDPAGLGDEAYRQPFVQEGQRGTNLFALIPGREVPEEVVIVGAHYDHLGSSCASMPSGTVCNGATDNATGVAAVLAVGRALGRLPEPPRRSVVLALWDAEEDGLLGSRYYVDHPLVPLEDTVAYVNFDILGADLLPSLADTSFALGAETGGPDFAELVQQAIDQEALVMHRLSYIFGQLRSDYANFGAAGVPTVFFSDSNGACYHKTGDDFHRVDRPKLRQQSRIGFRIAATLAEQAARPQFIPPDPGLANYADAVALSEVFATGMRDLRFFPRDVQDELLGIAEELAGIVEDGPEAFDAEDAGIAVTGAAAAIEALSNLECLPQRREQRLARTPP
jgi:hypothetical protein